MIFGASIIDEREITSTLPNEPSQDGEANRLNILSRITELKNRKSPVILSNAEIPKLKK